MTSFGGNPEVMIIKMAGLTEVVAQCMALDEELTDITDKEERKSIILRHLDKVDSLDFVIPDFKTGR